MKENWYIFLIALLTNYTPEQCCTLYWTGNRPKYLKGDIVLNEMIELRDSGMKLKDIGSIYGLSAQAVYCRLKYHKYCKKS